MKAQELQDTRRATMKRVLAAVILIGSVAAAVFFDWSYAGQDEPLVALMERCFSRHAGLRRCPRTC